MSDAAYLPITTGLIGQSETRGTRGTGSAVGLGVGRIAMTIDWDDYAAYDPGVAGPLSTVSRAEACAAFDRCMDTRIVRIDGLRRLVAASGLELGRDDAAIQDLNDWFYAGVEADSDHPGRLLPAWCSVVHDVGVFLGDVMIERHPTLRWELFTWGKKSVAYQRYVIMGLSTEEASLRTNIDIDRLVSTYGHRIIASRGSVPTYGQVSVRGVELDVDAIARGHRDTEIETDAFWRWLQMAARRA